MTETMKPSGTELIGDIPSSWDAKPLKYCVAINKDVLLESTKPDYTFRYIDIGSVNFSEGITGYEEVTFENAPSRARRIVHNGDTIVSTVRTYLKAISRIDDDKDVIASTGFAVLTPTHTDSGFLEFFCKSEAFCDEIVKQSSGIAYPAVNASQVGRVYMPIPPLPEQQVIAAFLDDRCGQIDVIVADLERQVEILRQYKKALITETVTKGLDKTAPMKGSGIDWIGEMPRHWEMKRVKHSTSVIGSGTTPESGNTDFYDGDIPWIQSGDLYGRDVIIETEKNITPLAVKSYSALRFYKNDFVIVAMYGASVGNVAISKISGYVNQACCVLLPNESNDVRYLYYWLATCKDDLVRQSFGGGQPNISQQKIKNEPYLQAPLLEQQRIADYLDHKCAETDYLIAEKQKAAETMRQYKKSLIYEYVTGKKRVTG